jgi:hypothetical protein
MKKRRGRRDAEVAERSLTKALPGHRTPKRVESDYRLLPFPTAQIKVESDYRLPPFPTAQIRVVSAS